MRTSAMPGRPAGAILKRAKDRRPGYVVKVSKRRIGKLGGMVVYAVDGEYIRDHVDVDFVAGGNPRRYGYIPEGELWVERILNSRERRLTARHEFVEYRLMQKGLDYEAAHDLACTNEVLQRHRSRRPRRRSAKRG